MCPSDTRTTLDPSNIATRDTSYGVNMVGYGEPSGNLNGPSISQKTAIVPIASIGSVSTCVFAADANNYQVQAVYADVGTANGVSVNTAVTPRTLGPGLTPTRGSMLERHLETANVLFCDGHVKAMKLDALLKRGTTPNAGKGTYFTRGADPE